MAETTTPAPAPREPLRPEQCQSVREMAQCSLPRGHDGFHRAGRLKWTTGAQHSPTPNGEPSRPEARGRCTYCGAERPVHWPYCPVRRALTPTRCPFGHPLAINGACFTCNPIRTACMACGGDSSRHTPFCSTCDPSDGYTRPAEWDGVDRGAGAPAPSSGEPERRASACADAECGWRGPASLTLYLPGVGLTCPECGDAVEDDGVWEAPSSIVAPAPSEGRSEPVAWMRQWREPDGSWTGSVTISPPPEGVQETDDFRITPLYATPPASPGAPEVRAAEVFKNRAISYFARLYGEEMEGAPDVVRRMTEEYFEILTGRRLAIDPEVSAALETVERAPRRPRVPRAELYAAYEAEAAAPQRSAHERGRAAEMLQLVIDNLARHAEAQQRENRFLLAGDLRDLASHLAFVRAVAFPELRKEAPDVR